MNPQNTLFNTPFGRFSLLRYPHAKQHGQQQSLRAWDAADEYLLNWLADQPLTADTQIMTVNDSFGALTTALHNYKLSMMSDSFLAHTGCRHNFTANHLDASHIEYLTCLDTPSQHCDYLLIKVPKTLSLLEEQLYNLRKVITANTVIVAAGMVKLIHNSTLKLFNDILGKTHTSLAKKKSRLIFCMPQPQQWQGASPFPTCYPLENSHFTVCNHANVFSRASLDIGTRLFLEHLPSGQAKTNIIDLGCGNGIVGLLAAEKNPQATLHFYDESYMAVASAKENFKRAFSNSREAHFHSNHCLANVAAGSAELILNNPPFHQGTVVGDHLALQMFADAQRVLCKGGQLWIIGNRHLGYHNKLKRLFGNVETVAANKKFVVLKSTK